MATTSPSPTPILTSSDHLEGAHRTPTAHEKTFNLAVWTLFTALWVVFLALLVGSQGTLGDVWHHTRDLPLIVQGVLWLLFLPVMAGLAIWDASWPFVIRLILIVGIAWVNVYLFFPWRKPS